MVLDLKTAGNNSGFLTPGLGGTFFATTDATQSTGTGNWDAFSRVQAGGNNTIEQGYNTAKDKVLDNIDGANTHTIQLSSIPTVTSGGQVYRVFGLDINQVNSQDNALLSLNQVQLFASTADPEAAYTLTAASPTTPPQIAFGAGFTELFRMNNSGDSNYFEIQLNASLNAGSGHDNMLLYINNAAFENLAGTTLITLFSAFGTPPGSFSTNDGFEEWAAITGDSIPTPPSADAPEPATIMAALMGLVPVALVGVRRLRRRPACV